MTRYEAILFDFDGVLADSEPVHFECWRAILSTHGLRLDWKTYRDHGIGVSDRIMLARLCQQVEPPFEVERLIAGFPRKKAFFRERIFELPPFSG